MSEKNVRRRGFGEDGIYLDAARNRYMGAVSLGYGPAGKRIRRKVSGKTKQEVRAKLQALHQELNSGGGSLEILDLTGRVIVTATATATVDAPSMR
jgi:hypothetical protein